MSFVKFPDGFLFGADISDYQHSGGLICDLPLIEADKHSTHYEEDFKILKELGLNAFRTSVEWARIEPEEGKVDHKAVSYYHKYLSKLKEMGVTTIVDLYHCGNPRWIHEHGGWASKEIVEKFLQHVDLATTEYYRYIDYYQTINEPPYAAVPFAALAAGVPSSEEEFYKKEMDARLNNIYEAIRRSYDIIHEKNSEAMVGVANPLGPEATVTEPGMEGVTRKESLDPRQAFFDTLSELIRGWNWYKQIEAQKGKFDYIGVNYYGMSVSWPGKFHTIMVCPEGLREVCKTVWEKYRKPMIITENGLPNNDDEQKTAFLVLHLKSLHDVITLDGAKAIGYCWWCFLPSWEFGMGMPNFGLVDVDTLGDYRRIVTQTALDYSEIIKNQGFPMRLYERCLSKRSSIRYENWL